MVKEIKANGRLKLALVGGSRWNPLKVNTAASFLPAEKHSAVQS